MPYCKNCGKLLPRNQTYCSNRCQLEYQQKEYIDRWKRGEESGVTGQYNLSKHIRNYLLKQANYKCEKCGWGEVNPFTQLIPLEIHHIDGDHTNNTPDNLQVLCPNCHALTNNFKSRGSINTTTARDRTQYYLTNTCIDCGQPITNTATRCKTCEQKYRAQQYLDNLPVTRDILKERIRKEPFEAIGRDYNISGNGLKRWIARYGLPNTKKQINQYSDNEWQQL